MTVELEQLEPSIRSSTDHPGLAPETRRAGAQAGPYLVVNAGTELSLCTCTVSTVHF